MRVCKLLIEGLDARVRAEVIALLALVLFHVRTAEFGTIVIVLVIIVCVNIHVSCLYSRTELAELLQLGFMDRARTQIIVHWLHKAFEEVIKRPIALKPLEP